MPFFGIKEILETFLRGALEPPNEALFQKGSRIFSMSTSFDGGLLDHLAELYFFCRSSHRPKQWDDVPPRTPSRPCLFSQGPPSRMAALS
jgi:hypothetical protein